MITKEKIAIYKRYNGDVDNWLRLGNGRQQSKLDSHDWLLLDGFIQDIRLIDRGFSAETYRADAEKRIKENCENEEIIVELKRMAANNKF